MTGAAVTRAEIVQLLAGKLAEVLGVEPSAVAAGTRFDEDLHADSLDLVEVIEGVESRLRARGCHRRLAEEDLMTVRTVGDAADRLLAARSEGPA